MNIDCILLTLTLKMTTAQVVEMSVTVNNNSPIQDYVHPDDQTRPTFEMTPGFKTFHIDCMTFSFFSLLPKGFILSALSHVPLGFSGPSEQLAIKRCLYCTTKLRIVWDLWDLFNCLQHSIVINIISGVSMGPEGPKIFLYDPPPPPPYLRVWVTRLPPNLKVWTCR